ncbi:MAG: ChbG/HpnK family deacetylase [Gemmatimonadetes bacterium]|nr:ChbG/HpnK family deacetylase [Gemmatimonadota bacterium]
MPISVILNADDLGLTAGINRAIFQAARAGAVTSASLMVGAPGWDDALAGIRSGGAGLSVGLHLNLTVGRPLTAAPTLHGRDGRFFSLRALVLRATTGLIDPDDVLAESVAQLQALAAAGVVPTHLDGHRHVHMLPSVGPEVLEAARRAGVRFVRVPLEPLREAWRRPGAALKQAALRASAWAARVPAGGPVRVRGMALIGARDVGRSLVELLDRLPPGVTEIAVHPGHVTPELKALDPCTVDREGELAALTSPDVLARLHDGSLRLIGFADL